MTNWTLRGVDLPVREVAKEVEMSEQAVQRLVASGVLGSTPGYTEYGRVQLYHVAGLHVWRGAERQGIAAERIRLILMPVATEAFLQFMLKKLDNGGWTHEGGTFQFGNHLWNDLKSDEGRDMLLEKLQLTGVVPRRFAYFGHYEAVASNHPTAQYGLGGRIDAWAVADQMVRAIPGIVFTSTVSCPTP